MNELAFVGVQETRSQTSGSCRRQESTNNLYMSFVDFKKAFDLVSHERLCTDMLEMAFPRHIVNLLINLYRKQKAKVKAAGTLSRGF